LFELKSKIAEEELQLWHAYFVIKDRRHQQHMEKIKRQGRR